MSFSRHRYHIVTGTKHRAPLITPALELILFDFIKHNAKILKGHVLHINGTQNHIHIIAAIPPNVLVSDFIARLKANSSRHVNKHIKTLPTTTPKFAWQVGYGSFTVDPYNMQTLINYVHNQKQHHAENTTIPHLECTKEPPPHPPPNPSNQSPKGRRSCSL